ncbi:MAG: phosphatidylserine decarboxylase family protein [Phycisphaerales bacterium]
MKIAPAAWPVLTPILICSALATGLFYLVTPALGLICLVLCATFSFWAVWFFRDPDRVPPVGPGLIISPADGRVIKIDQSPLPPEVHSGEPPMERIAIFLNLFNVHVNRVPCSGAITRTSYVPGKFLNASFDKASEHNERSAAVMQSDEGALVGFVQIAGLVARRIVNTLRPGQRVERGDRFGLIRFGSRAEVYLPPGTRWEVKVGDHVVAGTTVLARVGPASASPSGANA